MNIKYCIYVIYGAWVRYYKNCEGSIFYKTITLHHEIRGYRNSKCARQKVKESIQSWIYPWVIEYNACSIPICIINCYCRYKDKNKTYSRQERKLWQILVVIAGIQNTFILCTCYLEGAGRNAYLNMYLHCVHNTYTLVYRVRK